MSQPPPGGYSPGNPYPPKGYPPQQGYQPPPQQQGYPQPQQQGYPPPQPAFGAPAPAAPQQPYGAPAQSGQQPYGAPQAMMPGQPFGAQQQPYGAPQQQAAFGAPGLSPQAVAPVNLGGVNIDTAGITADLSPDALMGAVFGGKGFHSPRLLGGGMMGLSILLTVLNVVLILVLHRYYPYVYSVASIFWCGGLWLVITGQPRATADGTSAPIWARAGLGAACVVGILIGIALIFIPRL